MITENRNKIDEIDRTLMSLLDERLELVKIIGGIKKKENIPIFNKEREDEILSKTLNFKNSKFLTSIFSKILEESRKFQEEKCKSKSR